MIRNTFLHIPHIGSVTEQRFWTGGILTWDHFLEQAAGLRLSATKKEHIHRCLEESESRLVHGDTPFFARALPRAEQWRAWGDFGDRAGYLDIETTGGNEENAITVIGLSDGHTTQTFVRDENLEKFPEAVSHFAMLVTFNGASFDLPILRRTFPQAELGGLHMDLRFVLRRLGFSGGLKAIEQQLGLKRSDATAGMNGYDAVILWQKHLRGDETALGQLLTYNREDVENLVPLARYGYENLRVKMLKTNPFYSPHRF